MGWDEASTKRYDHARSLVSDANWSIKNAAKVLADAEARAAKKFVARFVTCGTFALISIIAVVYLYSLAPHASIPGGGNWALAAIAAPGALFLIVGSVAIHTFHVKKVNQEALVRAQKTASELQGELQEAKRRVQRAMIDADRKEEQRIADGEQPTVTRLEHFTSLAAFAAEATEREWFIYQTNKGKMAPHISTLVDDWEPRPAKISR